MVAYSFKERFCDKIVRRIKCHTIRNKRKRHARPGERVQLYYAQRTKHCRKLIPDPVCSRVEDIWIHFSRGHISRVKIGNVWVPKKDLERFAIQDGFESLADMAEFWNVEHSKQPYNGDIIFWIDQP